MFQHLHDLKAYQKTKNTLTTTPPNGDHDSKKRCVSPAGTLAGSRAVIVGSRRAMFLVACSNVTRWNLEPTHFENGLLKLDHLPRLV